MSIDHKLSSLILKSTSKINICIILMKYLFKGEVES
jgi:hypothetical protein